MRKAFVIAVIAFQIVVLAWMTGEREYLIRTGKIVYLRTAPIDPRDLFRGDFVRLDYEISAIPSNRMKGHLKDHLNDKGRKVYSVLTSENEGLSELSYITDEKPDSGNLFIRGRLTDNWRLGSSRRGIAVKYGIETYFVQQGKGIEIEKKRGNRDGIQIPLEMEVAVGSNGTAVLKNHRQSPIGIGIEILTRPEPNTQNSRKSVKIRLTLMNASDSPLALVNLPDNRSFFSEPSLSAQKEWKLARDLGEPPKPTDENVMVLQPDERKFFEFDFSEDRWWVKADKDPIEIGKLEWSEMFRLSYRPPSEKDCRHLRHKDIIWHGSLPSRAFHGTGRVD